LSLDPGTTLLCGSGASHEIVDAVMDGVRTPVWKHAPHTLTHLASRARSHGEQTFVILGEDRITYAAWFRAAGALARHLEAQGAAPGDRVALAMRNLPEWPVTCFAVAAVGAVVVPLNAWWTGDELAFALDDCGARVLLCDGERYDRLAARTGALAPLEHCLVARATPDTTPSTRLVDHAGHVSTRQYARLVDEWVDAVGLRRAEYGTHSLRRTKASMIYKATGNLRAIQILLGHTKIENTVRYLGVDIEDALILAERTEILRAGRPVSTRDGLL
jgi:acyl-CoA synthetase (AMP-forming)/AMP-acid ligase II